MYNLNDVPKFTYKKLEDKGLEVYELDDNLEIIGQPIAIINPLEFKLIGMALPSMYYPLVMPGKSPEIKTVYKVLKDSFKKGSTHGHRIIKIYNEKRNFLLYQEILPGRKNLILNYWDIK